MGKGIGYVIGGLELVVGAILTFTGIGAAVGIPLMVAGAATIAGTALTPAPPRSRSLRDSPTYGIDRFTNPRGPDALVPILYGEHRVKPVVIAESVREASENEFGNTRVQQFQWLGVVAEGEIESVWDIRINDREVFSNERDEELGRGNAKKKEFAFPHRWVHLGDDEAHWVEYDACLLLAERGWAGEILIDQGATDQFLEQLRPEAMASLIAERRQPGVLRMQAGYDHSYYFVASFGEDHVRWHAERLSAA